MNEENALVKMPNDQFDKFMCEKFPDLFRDRNKSMMETCMCWGFNTGEGWNQLIYDMCEKLDFIRKQTGIVTVFHQIKEKFGTGRFYYHIDSSNCKLEKDVLDIWCNFINDAVDKAEERTCQTCGKCGKQHWHSKINIDGWVYDCCKDCLDDSKKEAYLLSEKRQDRIETLLSKMYRMDDEELSKIEKYIETAE